jgi:hypothetical protein
MFESLNVLCWRLRRTRYLYGGFWQKNCPIVFFCENSVIKSLSGAGFSKYGTVPSFRIQQLSGSGSEVNESGSEALVIILDPYRIWNSVFLSPTALWNRTYFLRFRFRLLKSFGSGSGSDFWKVMVPVPVPTFEKLRFRTRFRFQIHI